jgi:hypothetical protein
VVEHGDVEGLSGLIDEIAALPREELGRMGNLAKNLIGSSFSADLLAGRFCELVEGLSKP